MPGHKAEVLDREDPARGIQLRVPCLTALDEDRIRQLADGQFAVMWAYFRRKRWM
jgi:hypothetical protein